MVDVVDVRIDFISELSQRNCEHIINQILENLSPITIIKCTKVNQEWNLILRSCNVFPHDLNRTFELYYQLNPFPMKSVMGDHLSTYSVESNRLYAGGDVKTILVENKSLFLGLASGMTKEYDLSNYDNFKYPASRFYDADNGKSVTHLSKNEKYLATGHGDLVLIWKLDSACIVSQAITLDSAFDFIGRMELTAQNSLVMLTRFNGRLRIYKDLFQNRYKEYIVADHPQNDVPKKISLSAYAFAFSYQYQQELPWFWNYKLTIYKILPDAEVDVKTFDMKREISWIFQDYPLLFLEMAYLGNKELQLWDCSTLTQLYSVGLNDPHVRFLGLKNFIFWCHIGQGKGQLTYGSVMDLLDQNFYNKKVIEAEDEKNEEWFLSFLDGSVLVFSKAGKIEMKIFGLQYDDLVQDDLSDDAQSLL